MYPANPGARASGFAFEQSMMKKIVLMIDGGFLRVTARKAGKRYDPDFIEAFSRACSAADEELFRTLYYDCAPYQGQQKLPVSGLIQTFAGSDEWLQDLAKRDLHRGSARGSEIPGLQTEEGACERNSGPRRRRFLPGFRAKGRRYANRSGYCLVLGIERCGQDRNSNRRYRLRARDETGKEEWGTGGLDCPTGRSRST